MPLPAALDFKANPSATPDRMNLAMLAIDARLRALEAPAKNLSDELEQLQTVGLQRLNDAIKPIYDEAAALTSLGAVFSAESSSALPVQLGVASFTISSAQLGIFAYSQWMSAMTSDAEAAMAGRVVSYDRTTGILQMSVLETYGSGVYASWIISPSSPPILTAAVVDGGFYDNSPQLNTEVPYLYSGLPSADGGMY